jgi:hypothetical protein
MAAEPVVFAEGFNSDYVSPWDGTANQNNAAFGNGAPGITNSGTAGFEGDGFAVKTWDRADTDGVTSVALWNIADLEVVEVAGVTYTFTGDFGWRNGSTNAVNDLFIHAGQSGFNGKGNVTNVEIGSIPSNTLETVSFSYTTVQADVGTMLSLRVYFADRDLTNSVVELLADDWNVTKSVKFVGFNSDHTNPGWVGGGGVTGQFGTAPPGITNSGTAGFEGDAFAIQEVPLPTTTFGSPQIFTYNRLDLGTVTAAGIKYTFTGEFGWRNATTNEASNIYVHNGWSGFSGPGGVSSVQSIYFDTFASNTLTTYTFSYTTTEADVGSALEFRLSLASQNNVTSTIELLADNWLISAEIDTVVPFAETPFQNGGNLIPNGDFLQNTTNGTVGTHPTYNITGSFGDFAPFNGGTVDVAGWNPFYDDPNGLTTNVGTPGQVDVGPVLEGTYYLDTHLNADNGRITLNSAMDYRNGLVQSNALNGVSIDTGKTYQFVVDGNHPNGTDTDSGVLTAKLTDGSGTPIAGSTLSDVTSGWTGTRIANVSGADLAAAGQVNVAFDHICTNQIPGYPTNVAPGDVSNIDIVAQAHVWSVALYEPITPEVGDLNHDGEVDELDVAFANIHLSGAADGGISSASRVANLMAQGMTEAEALEYLNLTEFDVNGDGTFDAADITAVEDLIIPDIVHLQAVPNGTNMTLVWNSNKDMQYDIVATNNLALGGGVSNWPVYQGHENIDADLSDKTNEVVIAAADAAMFFGVIEHEPVLSGPQTNALNIVDASFEIPWTSGGTDFPDAWNATLGTGPTFSVNDGGTASDGTAKARFANKQVVDCYQDVGTVTAGDVITVMVDAQQISGKQAGTVNLILEIDGAPVSTVAMAPASTAWQTFTNTHTVVTGGTLTIHLDQTLQFSFIDNVRGTRVYTP